MINTEIDSYVLMAPGGNYHDWASLSNLIKSNQYAIIKFSQFNKWYGEARFTNSNNKIAMALPAPEFIADSYEEAQDIVNKLNKN
jgi:hypothetical protein